MLGVARDWLHAALAQRGDRCSCRQAAGNTVNVRLNTPINRWRSILREGKSALPEGVNQLAIRRGSLALIERVGANPTRCPSGARLDEDASVTISWIRW
jgi:hypothetical protein